MEAMRLHDESAEPREADQNETWETASPQLETWFDSLEGPIAAAVAHESSLVRRRLDLDRWIEHFAHR
jgi:hypothetical protein